MFIKGVNCIISFIKFYEREKKNTIFCINPVDPDYKKTNKQGGEVRLRFESERQLWDVGECNQEKKISLYAQGFEGYIIKMTFG